MYSEDKRILNTNLKVYIQKIKKEEKHLWTRNVHDYIPMNRDFLSNFRFDVVAFCYASPLSSFTMKHWDSCEWCRDHNHNLQSTLMKTSSNTCIIYITSQKTSKRAANFSLKIVYLLSVIQTYYYPRYRAYGSWFWKLILWFWNGPDTRPLETQGNISKSPKLGDNCWMFESLPERMDTILWMVTTSSLL